MSDNLSERRLVENEVVFSQHNQTILGVIEKSTSKDKLHQPFDYFYCECSSAYCMERITVAPAIYTRVHQNKKRFIIKPGHETPSIEKVLEKKSAYSIVEKFSDPPPPGDAKLNL